MPRILSFDPPTSASTPTLTPPSPHAKKVTRVNKGSENQPVISSVTFSVKVAIAIAHCSPANPKTRLDQPRTTSI